MQEPVKNKNIPNTNQGTKIIRPAQTGIEHTVGEKYANLI
jgi:hypothetical protein